MKFNILLFAIIFSNLACSQKTSNSEAFLTKILTSNSKYEGEFHLTLDGTGELRNKLFQTVKIENFKESFREFANYKDILKIDLSVGLEVKVNYFPYTELTKILNEIKLMAEKYNCKTIVYIHSDLIK